MAMRGGVVVMEISLAGLKNRVMDADAENGLADALVCGNMLRGMFVTGIYTQVS